MFPNGVTTAPIFTVIVAIDAIKTTNLTLLISFYVVRYGHTQYLSNLFQKVIKYDSIRAEESKRRFADAIPNSANQTYPTHSS